MLGAEPSRATVDLSRLDCGGPRYARAATGDLSGRAAAALGNPDEPVRQHHRACSEEHARSTQPRRTLQAEPGAVADAGAIQPADRDVAVDVPARLVLGRIHLHV